LVQEILTSDGRACGLRVDGRDVLADVVLLGIGILPNIELAAEAGLAVSDGIEVDGGLRTSDPAIWAIGDCARHRSAFTGSEIRIESVQNATDQARHVARTLTDGGMDAYREVPWFWSHLGHDIVNIAGIATSVTHAAVIGDESARSFSILRWNGEELVCVESVNARADHLAARRLLAAGVSPTPDEVGVPGFTLRTLASQLGRPVAGPTTSR
jgi:3-phenylpropionate/trans-cinnamate dioxygenase ferredoxin reductase subunit